MAFEPFFYIDSRLTIEEANHHGDLVMRNALAQLNLDNPNDSFLVEEEGGMITHRTHEGALFLKFTDPHGISYFSQSEEGLQKLLLYFGGLPGGFLHVPLADAFPAEFFVNPVHFVANANHANANHPIGGYRRTRRTKRTKRSKRSKRTRRTRRKN